VNVVEYYVLMNENGKMRPVETILRMGEGIRENDGGVNLAMIYCKHFGKCHSVPSGQQNYDDKKVDKKNGANDHYKA
jgi:hypothetical protein